MKTNPQHENKHMIKEVIKNEITPFLIGLRSEIKDMVAAMGDIKDTNRPLSRADLFNMLKGEKGDSPVYGVDYLTPSEMELLKTELRPKAGIDYLTSREIELFAERATPVKGKDYFDGHTPIKGKDYLTDEELFDIRASVTPIKGVHYFDGKPGEIKTVTEVRYQNISPEDIRDKLESLKGHSRLKIKAIDGLQELLDRASLSKPSGDGGLGGSGGGSSVGGASAFIDLTDAPSSYSGEALKVVRVNAGETGLEFTTLAGGGDALTSDPLSQFAATTSLQLKGVISDETGSGALVFADTPTLVTPVLGEATGTGLTLSGLTASEMVITNGSKKLVSAAVATYPSLTELTYVKGVTSAIQTQINAKAPSTAPTFATSITGSYLTASEILITDGSKNIVSAAVATYPSLTELTYVKGVTSALQTQLDAKSPIASPTFTGVVTIPNTGLHILDTNASHDLIIAPGSNLTADKTLTLTTGDADVILDLTAVTDEYVLAYDTATNTWRGVSGGAGGGASTALDNLASVAINTTLVSDTDNTDDIGTSSIGWRTGYFDTSVISPLIVGGSGTTTDLTLKTTSGVGATGADMHFLVGNNGATEAMTILNNGNVGIGTTAPDTLLTVDKSQDADTSVSVQNTNGGTSARALFRAVNEAGSQMHFGVTGTGYTGISGWQDAGYISATNALSGGLILNRQAGSMKFQYQTDDQMTILSNGNVGIGTTAPDKKLEINLGTADALRLTYNDANGSAATYMDTTLSSTGVATFNAVGSAAAFVFSDPVTARITPRTSTEASSATPTINTDNVDFHSITALAAAITSFTTNLSGTPTTAQTLHIAITDNGTARAIAWGASFEASGNVALPITTVISTRLDVFFIWTGSIWRCIGVA